MSNRFVINNSIIEDLQSDWCVLIDDVDDRFFVCEKLNCMDDEVWEYRQKYMQLRTKLHKISELSFEK